MTINEKLKKLNISLPDAPAPVGSYVAFKIVKNFLYISGQISVDENRKLTKGKLGKDLTTDQGVEAAKLCAINILAQAKKACHGNLDKIVNCVKITGFVNSTSDFVEQPKVINGASDFISLILDDKGKHTRAAISANSLPLGVAVEVDAVFEIE